MKIWQPIETAPKINEKPILAYGNGIITTVQWSEAFKDWFLCWPESYDDRKDWQVTHWMELPAPPPVCKICEQPIDVYKVHVSTGTGYAHERCFFYKETK